MKSKFLLILVFALSYLCGSCIELPVDTINIEDKHIKGERIWPLGCDSMGGVSDVFLVLQYSDTLLVLTNSNDIFQNNQYSFKNKEEILKHHKGHKVSFFDGLPMTVDIMSYKSFDMLTYVGYYSEDYRLSFGDICTNELFQIDDKVCIGSRLSDVLSFLGLSYIRKRISLKDQYHLIFIQPLINDQVISIDCLATIRAIEGFDLFFSKNAVREIIFKSARDLVHQTHGTIF